MSADEKYYPHKLIDELQDNIDDNNGVVDITDLMPILKDYHAKEMERVLREFKNWMERMIEGCDSLGGMEREKSVYQSVLKKFKATTHLKEQKQDKG